MDVLFSPVLHLYQETDQKLQPQKEGLPFFWLGACVCRGAQTHMKIHKHSGNETRYLTIYNMKLPGGRKSCGGDEPEIPAPQVIDTSSHTHAAQ